MQAMVDFRGLFMHVYIGWPGKVHNARVFVNSSLYRKGRNSVLFPDWKRTICRVQVSIMTLKKFTSCITVGTVLIFHTVIVLFFRSPGTIGSSGRPSISCSTMANEAIPGDTVHYSH